MNSIDPLHPIARYFPYCALSARYKFDSGDGDQDTTDYIDDTIKAWYPRAKVSKYHSKLDFNYVVEMSDSIICVTRGTEGRQAWYDNFSPFPLYRNRAHNGFYEAAGKLYKMIHHHFYTDKHLIFTGQSRGGPITQALAMMTWSNLRKRSISITYSAPPIFTRSGKKEFNECGLFCYRVINPHDVVDNLGQPILKHVGKKIVLPRVKNVLNRIPIIGWLFGGHAYTSIFDGLIARAVEEHDFSEAQYLRERKGYCTI